MMPTMVSTSTPMPTPISTLAEIVEIITTMSPPEAESFDWPFFSWDQDEYKFKCVLCDRYAQVDDGHCVSQRHKSRVSSWKTQASWTIDMASPPPSSGPMYAKWIEPMPEEVRKFYGMHAPTTRPGLPPPPGLPLALTSSPHSANPATVSLPKPKPPPQRSSGPCSRPGSSGDGSVPEGSHLIMAATIARLEADIKDLKNENTALWMEMEGLKKSLKALNVPVYTGWG